MNTQTCLDYPAPGHFARNATVRKPRTGHATALPAPRRPWFLWWVALVAAALGMRACEAEGQEILEFEADWCRPCVAARPLVEALAKEGIPFRKINIDREPELAQRFGAPPLPLFVSVTADGHELERVQGPVSAELLRTLWSHLSAVSRRQATPAKTQPIQNQSVPSQFVMRGQFPRDFLLRAQAEANAQRHKLALIWLGHELPAWQAPCDVELVPADNHGGGNTWFAFDNGKATQFSAKWEGTEQAILQDVIPHEVLHTVLATHFGRQVPRWADEGAATSVEQSPKIRAIHRDSLLNALKGGRGFATSELWSFVEYPKDYEAFYTQSGSLAAFLIQANGPWGFVGFVEDGLAGTFDAALKSNYDFDSPQKLQEAWLDWVRAGSPPTPHQVAYAGGGNNCGRCFRWQPFRRLWEGRPGFVFPKCNRSAGGRQRPAQTPQTRPSQPTGSPYTPPYVPPQTAPPATSVEPVPPLAPVSPLVTGPPPITELSSSDNSIKADLAAELERVRNAAAAEKQKFAADLENLSGTNGGLLARAASAEAKAKNLADELLGAKAGASNFKAQLDTIRPELDAFRTRVASDPVAQNLLIKGVMTLLGVSAGPAGWITAIGTLVSGGLGGFGISKLLRKPTLPALQPGDILQFPRSAVADSGPATFQGINSGQGDSALPPVLETQVQHHTTFVPFETNDRDKAWNDAISHIGNKYPGAVPYLTLVTQIKDDALAAQIKPKGEING